MNAAAPAQEPALRRYTHWIYGLHALSVASGLLGSHTIAVRFLFGLPSIVAVIMNYARRDAVRGSWLESHFRWQIRTFWFALLWVAMTSICAAPLLLVGIGIVLAWIGFGLTGAWILYRVIRGWLALREGRPLPLAT
ncbi:MAG: hypothetical protein IT480_13515 [Gammaproteobacteria bacterium]|nr:hypothetical protein [Gammaproteobacteria bacterium]